MKISGFTFVRNGILYGYPFLESIQSILPLCDELVVAVGRSEDRTLDALQTLSSPKIRIIETVWDESLRIGGTILAQQTDIALNHVTGDWAFYLQADEVIHEHDLPRIRQALELHHGNGDVEGLLFHYLHFYGSYGYIGSSRKWYRREIRIVRTGTGVHSWGDAQGFRIGGRKLRVKLVDASVYHYGWVKPPRVQQLKQKTFHRLWHTDDWVEHHIPAAEEFDYASGGTLAPFAGTHPAVMHERIRQQDWAFVYDEKKGRQGVKDRILDRIEHLTGYRVAEYKNYELI